MIINTEVMKLMFVTLGGQEVIDDAYLERGDFWPKILEYGNAVAKATMNDAAVELTDNEIARHLGYSDVSDILNGYTILPKDIIDNVRSAISAQIAKQSGVRDE